MKKFISLIRDPYFWRIFFVVMGVALIALVGLAETVVRFLAYWRIALGH